MTKRILIVDDQRHVLTLLESALEPLLDLGIELAVTQAAEEAVAAAMERCPDLALVDANMPGMDGYQVCERLIELPTATPPYIILMGEKGGESDSRRALEAGADDFLVKPFDPDDVLDRVSKILGIDLCL
jgi:two-component system, OmpR family, alkaline phosphatase synthesis response regulator PhoP